MDQPEPSTTDHQSALVDPTVILQPSDQDGRPPISNEGSVDSTHSMATVQDGMFAEEAARARTIGLVFFVVIGISTVWAPFLDGDPILKIPMTLAMALFASSSLGVWWLAAKPVRYTRRVFRLYGVTAVLASTMILAYLGPFSPTALAVTLGIAFFSQGADRVGAWAISLSAIGLYLALFLLIMTGVMPDRGLFQGDEAGLSGRIFMVCMVPLVLLVTHMQARWSRAAVEKALQSAVDRTAEANRRKVQLEEAHAELDRLAANGKLLGYLSGREVGWYRLGHLLGKGGSGEVYEAVDSRNSSTLAIKILHANEMGDPEIAERFQREGEIATRLMSPNVARVHQYGRAKGGTMYIAMEKLNGEDLATVLRRESRLDLPVVTTLTHDLCQGIADAHKHGIIHRDIKPHNIFWDKDSQDTGAWKVLDFGVSKLTSTHGTLTKDGVVGTPQYMSPEQARGEPVDNRTDVFGIGAVLYRALTGRPPIKGKSHTALYNAAYSRPVRPRLVAPELSKQVEAVLAVAMAPKPDQRFGSVQEFRAAFDQAVADRLPEIILRRARGVPWSSST